MEAAGSELLIDKISLSAKQIPEESTFEGNVFPLTLGPLSISNNSIEALEGCLIQNKATVDDLLRVHRGILFRGFALSDYKDFDRIVKAIDYQGMLYLGGAAVRTQLSERVFTANESPSSEKIPFHHEMAQTPMPPTHLVMPNLTLFPFFHSSRKSHPPSSILKVFLL